MDNPFEVRLNVARLLLPLFCSSLFLFAFVTCVSFLEMSLHIQLRNTEKIAINLAFLFGCTMDFPSHRDPPGPQIPWKHLWNTLEVLSNSSQTPLWNFMKSLYTNLSTHNCGKRVLQG